MWINELLNETMLYVIWKKLNLNVPICTKTNLDFEPVHFGHLHPRIFPLIIFRLKLSERPIYGHNSFFFRSFIAWTCSLHLSPGRPVAGARVRRGGRFRGRRNVYRNIFNSRTVHFLFYFFLFSGRCIGRTWQASFIYFSLYFFSGAVIKRISYAARFRKWYIAWTSFDYYFHL